jgi:hypothetical protein
MPRCACRVLRQSDYVSGHVIDFRPMNEFPSTCGVLASLSDIFEVAGTFFRRNPLQVLRVWEGKDRSGFVVQTKCVSVKQVYRGYSTETNDGFMCCLIL